jgi:hypothetical protein
MHMDELRKIERHDREMSDSEEDANQRRTHAQDNHTIDTVLKGFGERRAQEQHQRGGEKHSATLESMKRQPEPAE